MNEPTNTEIYVVDVCGTLVRDDTTLGLLRHHYSRITQRRLRHFIFILLRARCSPFRLGFIAAERLTGKHLFKHFVVRMLAGDKMIDLEHSAKEYATYLLTTRTVPAVWSLLYAPLQNGHVVLASASLEPVVAALANATGARYVASALEHRNGVLTGRYLSDLTGRKEQALIEKYGQAILAGQVCVISDNFSDRPLLAKAAKAYVVLHADFHRQRWQGLSATFLEVSK